MVPMSDPAPMARFDPEAPDADEVRERHVVWRVLRRARAGIVLVPLLVGVLVAASIGASKLWADIPERSRAEAPVTCWDGSSATLGECPVPAGRAGLRYVYPSFRAADDDGSCSAVPRRGRGKDRPVEFACALRFDQRPVTVVYSARSSLQRGLNYLRRLYQAPAVPEADDERLVFRAQEPDELGVYRTTVAYADHPFSVTVEAPDVDVRDLALGELVQLRPADRILTRG